MTEAVEGTLLWEPSEEFQENANIESKEDESGSTQPEAQRHVGPGIERPKATPKAA